MRRSILMPLGLLVLGALLARGEWYKGQLHCHSKNSFDGELSVAELVAMYKAAGYSFIVISDHNFITQARQYNSPDFLVIPGVELCFGSGKPVVPGNVAGPIHVNAIGISRAHLPPGIPTTLQGVIDLALSDPGVIVQINHPAATGITPAMMLKTRGALLLEVIQGASDLVANTRIWDTVLSAGMKLYGVGSDDCHNRGNFNRAWIVVRSARLTEAELLAAIRNGEFYASNGPAISLVSMTNGVLSVLSNGSEVAFVGRNGGILERVRGGRASYAMRAGDLYVRAVVSDKSGRVAYTQPYFSNWRKEGARPATLGATPAEYVLSIRLVP